MPRRKFDFYETPPHYIDALLHRMHPTGVIVDPCVGRGNIADAIRPLKRVTRVVTNDLDTRRVADYYLDARDRSLYRQIGKTIDWGITNPPFSQEMEIIERMHRHCRNIAVLARLSFLEPALVRDGFWRTYGHTVEVIVLPRYSFRKNDKGKKGSDSMTCCWLIWRGRPASIGISLLRAAK